MHGVPLYKRVRPSASSFAQSWRSAGRLRRLSGNREHGFVNKFKRKLNRFQASFDGPPRRWTKVME